MVRHTDGKSLVFHCMPFMENGVGSAWGLPVIASGKERFSALSLSEKLQGPGIISLGADPFRAERLRELTALGIGPLGRYLGGEPIKPIRLGPKDFFSPGSRNIANAAELFCASLEFDDTHWITDGTAEELFRGHLEFLRTWGFSGGINVDDSSIARLLADYIYFLQQETARENPKIIILVSRHFFETRLGEKLPNAKVSADTAAGEIPVNYYSDGTAVFGDTPGMGIALYEDNAPVLSVQKIRCDILIIVKSGQEKARRAISLYAEETSARQKITISAVRPEPSAGSKGRGSHPEKKKTKTISGGKKEFSPNTYLYRDIAAPPLPFLNRIHFTFTPERQADLIRIHNKLSQFDLQELEIQREEAAFLDIVPQWEAGRVSTVFGCLFTVNSKFSGLAAADFKEEQFYYYREPYCSKKPKDNWDAPPIRTGTTFSALNEIQLDFFLQWRSECRRGFIHIPPDSVYIENYIRLYAGELALCMGKEGPLQHFIALMHLFHACRKNVPETADLICSYCVDFAVIYGIGKEAFPVFVNELLNTGWFDCNHNEIKETEELIIDLAISCFCIEKKMPQETAEIWPLIKKLVPLKIINRKENDNELPLKFCRTLGILDAQLRQDWHRSFFTLFFSPLLIKTDFKAFEDRRIMGDSSYTVYRPGFTSHKPLIDILSLLVLEPEKNPLPGIMARLHPLSLENELLEELREESDAVREMLKYEENNQTDYPQRNAPKMLKTAYHEEESTSVAPLFTPLNNRALLEFFASLGRKEQVAIKNILLLKTDNTPSVSETLIDTINSAFYEQFGDLLIETGSGCPSISAEYAAIMGEWE